jgi:hypothetical protein
MGGFAVLVIVSVATLAVLLNIYYFGPQAAKYKANLDALKNGMSWMAEADEQLYLEGRLLLEKVRSGAPLSVRISHILDTVFVLSAVCGPLLIAAFSTVLAFVWAAYETTSYLCLVWKGVQMDYRLGRSSRSQDNRSDEIPPVVRDVSGALPSNPSYSSPESESEAECQWDTAES